MRAAACRGFRLAAASGAGVGLLAVGPSCFAEDRKRFQELPACVAHQRYQPPVAYPGWDQNWDHQELTAEDVAKRLGDTWPIKDYPDAIRKLYAANTDRTSEKVDKLIEDSADDLPALYTRAYVAHCHGGAATRHIILVRHGQYNEQRDLSKKLSKEKGYGTPGDPHRKTLDDARTLTELGKQQALRTGERLAELLKPALTTPGREADVRVHVSTMTRAKETAQLLASKLPSHVRCCDPDPLLVEGTPALTIPYSSEEAAQSRGDGVHEEGDRAEAAFHAYFYRDVPHKPLVEEPDDKKPKKVKARHEYEIIVCHMNLIRFLMMRALQLPPEAWLRFGGFNGNITHIKIRPNGNVSVVCFGDAGHLSLEETTFGMTKGLES